ncbi:hypothetical protein [Achromobacter spanius]|uniref:hypothetical protein n=1 Tax=Achromobacter spanius TaxID=217203 RepID=UPI00383081C5
MNDSLASHELFEELFTARCSCRSECCKGSCSEMAWLGRAQRFVQSYLPALVEARNAAPDSLAWWSRAAKRNPVPTMPEYFELLEHTAGVSVSAREKMTQYLDRELPGFDKALGCNQARLCLDHYHYHAMIAANPPLQPPPLTRPGIHCGAACLAASTPGAGGGINIGPVSEKAHAATRTAVFLTALTVFLAAVASVTFLWAAKAIADYRLHEFWTEIRGTGGSGPEGPTRLGSGNDPALNRVKVFGR